METEQVPELYKSLIQGKLAHIVAYRTALAAIEGKEPPAVGDIPDAVRLLRRPSAADVGRSVAHAEPVEMFGVQFWAEGFGLPTGVTENYGLGLPLARTIALEIHALLPVPQGIETAAATRALTEKIKTILYTHRFMENLRVTVAKELRLPVPASVGDVRPGRIDITAMYGLIPSIVIELDSTNKTSSLDKLEYARDHGAYPIWVRWNASAASPAGRAGIVTVSPSGIHGLFLGEDTCT
ncbi:hypothetical protein [Arthrobacter sp. NPDC056493]|uniref:hypothetical protein n=1 Tax=Arthrobacter sp. NPDC056493 TaxID=3345839 RepID=UPI0036701E36